MKLIATAALVALLAAPAGAGVVGDTKDALNDADAWATELLDGSTLESAMSLQWLVDIGDWWKSMCAKAGGEWVDDECVR